MVDDLHIGLVLDMLPCNTDQLAFVACLIRSQQC